MEYNPEIHHRRSIRLKGYDYSQEGMYFITICVQDRECLFGEIVVGANDDSSLNYRANDDLPINYKANDNSPQLQIMILNDAGKIAEQCWLSIPEHFPNTILHEYVVMPNHIHGIIEITGIVGANHHSPVNETDTTDIVGAKDFSPLNNIENVTKMIWAKNFSPQQFRSPSRTIGSIIRGFKIGVTKWFDQSIWQRDYYEHIIWSTEEYERIAHYIINNPLKWREDKFFK